MKLNKILFCSISTITLPFGFISNTSCSKNKDDTTENEYTDYIKQRTFALMGSDSGTNVFGTGWILSDSTPTIHDDYCYWMATNMHVPHAFYTLLKDNFKLYYADNNLAGSDNRLYPKSYIEFQDFNYTNLKNSHDNPSYFLYDDWKKSPTFFAGIDLIVFEVDFKNCPIPKIVTKLDQLNAFQTENGYINKFVTIGDDSPIHQKNKHVAGYPYSSSERSTAWECHNITNNQLKYSPYYQVYASNQVGHAIGTPIYDQQGNKIKYEAGTLTEAYYYYDVSPQYLSSVKRKSSYLSGGASGSMIIDDDYNTVGIYWGGWQSGNDFYPAFSLFNTSAKNFIERYL